MQVVMSHDYRTVYEILDALRARPALFLGNRHRRHPFATLLAFHDFTALDQLMPHPVYAPLSWVCVLNPSAATFDVVRPLLAEAYQRAVGRNAKRETRE
jgi:hypothetical protein